MKITIIVPYFGTLPNYFQLFLNSCRHNSDFNWIIFTDDLNDYLYPENVSRVYMTFSECQQLVRSKFDFNIAIDFPQKICDYRCAFGLIFDEYLNDSDWWGHCDLDQLFGDLNSFITPEMLSNYDKLFSHGHLTLYKNNVENNNIFKYKLNGKLRYKEVFSSNLGYAFDEWLPESINDIYLQLGLPVMLKPLGADINPYCTTFQTVDFDVYNRKYVLSSIKNSIFEMRNGHIYQIYQDGNELREREYPYIHLQKRNMIDKRNNKTDINYFIIPNAFIDKNLCAKDLLKKSSVFRIINFQYFKNKFNSLKYRIKNNYWVSYNVFKS